VSDDHAVVGELLQRVSLLEQRLSLLAGAEPVDLDTVDEATRTLVMRAERARERAAALLSKADRELHTARVEHYRALRGRLDDNTATALDLSATLAEAAYGTPEHYAAATRFRALAQAIEADQAQLADAATAAEESTQILDQAERLSAAHGPHLTTGDAVHAALARKLRDRISAAVACGAPLPVWFTTVLGHRPPADHAERWIQTAISLVTYRLTYAVTDPVVALGPPADDRRGDWRRDLDETMRDLRG
jgi:nucleoid-associated protein YgaU